MKKDSSILIPILGNFLRTISFRGCSSWTPVILRFSAISTNSSKKKWLLNHLKPSGSFIIDDGARNAILKNKSLLPAGIIEIRGRFKKGDVISILVKNGSKVAVGISAYDYSDAKKIVGKKSKEISKILGFEGRDEVIHKDNLVKFSTWVLKIIF